MRICVYDSGIGGRSVYQLLEQYINTNDLHHRVQLAYFADIAHYPYGTKTEAELKAIITQNLINFEDEGIDCIAVACNTASAVIERHWDEIPKSNERIRTIVRPTVDVVNKNPEKYPSLFVIASEFTANQHIYQKAVHKVQPQINITEQSEQTLINHIEVGLKPEIEVEVASIVAKVSNGTTLLMGCTHFSIVQEVFFDQMKKQSKHFQILDPAKELAKTMISMING